MYELAITLIIDDLELAVGYTVKLTLISSRTCERKKESIIITGSFGKPKPPFETTTAAHRSIQHEAT